MTKFLEILKVIGMIIIGTIAIILFIPLAAVCLILLILLIPLGILALIVDAFSEDNY